MEVFRAIDVDKKGFLTLDDFVSLCQRLGFPELQARDVFDCLDVDDDGKINNNDFINGLYRFTDLFSSQNRDTSNTASDPGGAWLTSSSDDQQTSVRNDDIVLTFPYANSSPRSSALKCWSRFSAQINVDIERLTTSR
jgi:hypothetical protein